MAAATFATLQTELGNELVVDLTLTISFSCAVVRVLGTLTSTWRPITRRIWSSGRYQRKLTEGDGPPTDIRYYRSRARRGIQARQNVVVCDRIIWMLPSS
ncbi:MAG: hypothetical protein EXR05_06505 [Acetobacteraceae bacterium]|nr:hypothetical protein [Acetobacteraceae bacterium]MSP29800.1 hypothetical protein [Acetobacteraceae bacterium]